MASNKWRRGRRRGVGEAAGGAAGSRWALRATASLRNGGLRRAQRRCPPPVHHRGGRRGGGSTLQLWVAPPPAGRHRSRHSARAAHGRARTATRRLGRHRCSGHWARGTAAAPARPARLAGGHSVTPPRRGGVGRGWGEAPPWNKVQSPSFDLRIPFAYVR